jgi:hypothetical protein
MGIPPAEVTRPKGFPIEGKKHMKELKNKFDMGFNEINHKIDMKVKKDYQVIISPFLVKVNLQPGFIILDAIPTVRILYLCQVVCRRITESH